MIVHENSEAGSQANEYNQTYGRENQQLSGKPLLNAIDALFSQSDFWPASCLDVSCGQGQVLGHIFGKAKEQSPHLDGHRFVGLDTSKTSIEQCEANYPDLSWIADSYQNFAGGGGFERVLSGGVDLIVNRLGFTASYSEDEYVDALEKAKSSLTENGRYLFVANRSVFQKWALLNARAWKRDPLQIVFDVFGEPEIHANPRFHFMLFAKNPKAGAAYPRSVDFTFEDGSTSARDVYFDPMLRERIVAFREDRPRVKMLMKEMRLSVSPDLDVAVTKKLHDADPSFHMVEGRIRLSSAYRQGIHEFSSPAADKIVLGGSFSDWLIDSRTGQPTVDLDEFHVSCDFLFSKLRASGVSQIVYLAAFPRSEGKDKLGFIYSPDVAKPYRDALRELAERYDIIFHDLTDAGPDPTVDAKSRSAWAAAILRAAKEAIQ